MLRLICIACARAMLTLSSFSMVLMFYVFVAPLNFSSFYVGECIIRFLVPILIVLFLAVFSLFFIRHVAPKTDNITIECFRQLEGSAMPTYIGLFVISLGLGEVDCMVAAIVLTILLILWRCLERNTYFNPVWLFMGYNFYEVQTKRGNNFTVILRRANLKATNTTIDNLIRINEYTYMEA